MTMTMKSESMRHAFGEALAAYGAANPRLFVVAADVSHSTQTYLFGDQYPERFINVGVAEAGAVDVAAGLALAGKIAFADTFAFLLALRAAEQIRTCVAYPRLNVKLCAGYAGLSDSFDGPTHHSVSDLATMRAMPNMAVVVAADAAEARLMVPLVAEWDGPVYLRLSRAVVPTLFDASHPLELGKGIILRAGSDVTLIGTGVLLVRCLEAAEMLAGRGVSARVLEIHTLKPLDSWLIREAADETGALVTIEEHSIVGGLGSAVAEVVTSGRPVPVERVGISDCFCETGPYETLLDRYGMSVDAIVAAAERAVARKG